MKSENQSNSAMAPFADAPPSYDNTATFMSRQSQLPNNAGRGNFTCDYVTIITTM